ncbi:hypothetical protein [Reticulibacter mediterranei]|uniref:hypothetical protein n=1 Tax=Reticulibacter mediterranei TaxID=2778369 RepID=UPI001C68D4CC|nr:hypothetical protein [Reticulibacter mediterranei]
MNTVFSTVDRFASRFKPVDTLINHIATRLLPQHEAKGGGCPSGTTYNGWTCGNYCRPAGDLQYELLYLCGFHGGQYLVRQCCDCCS